MLDDLSLDVVVASTGTTTPNLLEDDVARARDLSDQLARGPCTDAQAGEVRCLDREAKLAKRESRGFTSYRHDRMCEPCAAYWFAEMSALILEHVLWQKRMASTDARRSAG